MNRFNKKSIAFIIILLLGGVIAFKVYQSKTGEMYYSLEDARANKFFVRRLELSVSELEPNSLLEFENLEQLYLSFRWVAENKEEWAKIRLPTGLKLLQLRGVHESLISTFAGQVIQLETLNVICDITRYHSGNTIPSDFSLNEYKALRKLKLSLCSYGRLSVKAGEITRLESIEIFSQNFKRLPVDLLSLRNLKRLKIQSAAFENLPSGFNKLKGLEEVDLEFSPVKSPLVELRRLPNLVSLRLSGSIRRGQELSLDIKPGDFPALEKLHLWAFRINKLIGLERLGNLKDLKLKPVSLSESRTIWSFPPGLQRLDLSGMNLRKVPPGIENLTELRTLDLSENCLTDLPPEFRRLKKLRWIDLDHNGILWYPESLMNSPGMIYYNDPESRYYEENCRK